MKRILLLPLFLSPAEANDFTRARVDNWPQWRGPLATGMAPKADPPVKWDQKTNLRWKAAIPGRGSATPIVWQDQVFVVTAVDTGRVADAKDIPKPDPRFRTIPPPPTTFYKFLVLGIDRNTGKVRWQRTAAEVVPHEGHHPTHSFAAASPTTDGERLYVSFGSRGVYCYDLAGSLKWRRDLGLLHTRLGWGEGSSPVIHGDKLLVSWDQEEKSCLFALDARTGKTRWKVDRDEPTTWATPLVVDYKGRTQVIVNGTNRVRSYDLADGKVIWQCGGQTLNAIPSPVAGNGVVYCMTGYKGAAAFAIPLDVRGDITGAGKEIWQHHKGTPYVPSPLLADGLLYFTQMNQPVLTCLDVRTGKPVIDHRRLPGLDSLYASPVGAAGRVYFVGRNGTTLVLERGPTLKLLASNRLDEPIDASPVVVGRQLFLRGEKHLYCIEAK